jgi:hypothetical protein
MCSRKESKAPMATPLTRGEMMGLRGGGLTLPDGTAVFRQDYQDHLTIEGNLLDAAEQNLIQTQGQLSHYTGVVRPPIIRY